MLRLALILSLVASAAQAQTSIGIYSPALSREERILLHVQLSGEPAYLVHPDMAACLARSAAQCQRLGCQPGTTYWWSCEPLTDGTASVVIRPGDPDFGSTTRGQGLNAAEITALKNRPALGTKLRDVIPSAAFLGRISAAKKTAVQTYATTHPRVQAALAKILAGNVDLQDPQMQQFIADIRAAGLIDEKDENAMLALQITP